MHCSFLSLYQAGRGLPSRWIQCGELRSRDQLHSFLQFHLLPRHRQLSTAVSSSQSHATSCRHQMTSRSIEHCPSPPRFVIVLRLAGACFLAHRYTKDSYLPTSHEDWGLEKPSSYFYIKYQKRQGYLVALGDPDTLLPK